MPRKRKGKMVRFIVELEDGSKHILDIDTFTLRSGDDIARIIASEQQAGGRMPKGGIKSIKRTPYSEWPLK